MKITVLGSGGWGTALSLLLLENGNDVTLWSYTQEESRVLRETHENPMLKGVPLPPELKFTTDMAAVKGCELVVLATPSFAVRSTAAKLKELSVKVVAKAGNGGRLFGAVTSKEISEALQAQFDLTIAKSKIVQEEPIKSFGTYQLKCKLGYEIIGTVNVVVTEET